MQRRPRVCPHVSLIGISSDIVLLLPKSMIRDTSSMSEQLPLGSGGLARLVVQAVQKGHIS